MSTLEAGGMRRWQEIDIASTRQGPDVFRTMTYDNRFCPGGPFCPSLIEVRHSACHACLEHPGERHTPGHRRGMRARAMVVSRIGVLIGEEGVGASEQFDNRRLARERSSEPACFDR